MAAGAMQQSAAEDKKLIVGNHIRLKGEVTSCDTMIVEGQVELSRSEARHIQISPTGIFLGDVEVDEADISGRFEGGLTARERGGAVDRRSEGARPIRQDYRRIRRHHRRRDRGNRIRRRQAAHSVTVRRQARG
ncbi:MAG: polymer-forming cytoskeletal protein [Rhodospirillales bacterium]|nr:polymer-forming cytoskeletal protein [Rhodospirillales bacterium]